MNNVLDTNGFANLLNGPGADFLQPLIKAAVEASMKINQAKQEEELRHLKEMHALAEEEFRLENRAKLAVAETQELARIDTKETVEFQRALRDHKLRELSGDKKPVSN